MRIKTTVGRVAMRGGQRTDQPGGILVEEQGRRLGRPDRGALYLLVEVTGPVAGRDIIADQLARLVRDVYYSRRGSVTSGLQQALQEANNLLYEENRTSLPGERRTAGISCLVLRGADLFIAQSGPTAVYWWHEGQVSRLPDLSPWLDEGLSAEELGAAALGERREPNIALFHCPVEAGDTFLLTESSLARRIPLEQWPGLLSVASAPRILEAVVRAGGGNDLSALVVMIGEEQVTAALPPTPAEEKVLEAPEVARPSLWDSVASRLTRLQIGRSLRAAGRALVTALASFWAMCLVLLRRMMPGPPSETPAPVSSKAREKPKKRPVEGRKARKPEKARRDPVQKVLVVVAILIPLVVIAGVAFMLVQREQTRRAELESLWQQADAAWQRAKTTTDQAAIRTHLTEASNALDQLLKEQPNHAEALDLRRQIEVQLDTINQVKRVTWVGDLNSYPADAELSRVVVEGAHVFVLDRRTGKVYHHRLNDLQQALLPDSQHTVLVSKGSQVEDVLVGDLVDMTWMPAGEGRQKESLVILESGGSLLEYDLATEALRPLRMAATDAWRYPRLVGSYYGRFYLLDPTANQIWRYFPTADGYSNPPDEWLQVPVTMTGVVDMAIGDSIYLIYADGQIQRFTAGQSDTFDISDWDTPPRNPAAIFTRPPDETKWVYVADRGNSRIVQVSPEGRFQRQFRLAHSVSQEKGDILGQVTSLFVDEISGHAYLLSGSKLYLLLLPE